MTPSTSLIEKIKEYPGLINAAGKINGNISKGSFLETDLYKSIYSATSFLESNDSLAVRVYCVEHNITTRPVCGVCAAPVKFKSKKFNDYCSVKCGAAATPTRNKRLKSCREKYGVDNPSKSIDVQQKRTATVQSKYGVDNPFQSEKIKEKIKKSFIDTHGVNNPSQLETIKNKKRQTSIERYGIPNPQSLISVQEKSMNTNQERFGTMWPSQSPAIQDKIKETINNRYNADNYFSSDVYLTKQKSDFMTTIGDRVKGKLRPRFTEFEGVHHQYEWECIECSNIFVDNLISGKMPRCTQCFPITSSMWESEVREFVDGSLNNRYLIPPLEIDIFIPEHNIAIECNGIYWHSENNGKNRKYHLSKTEECSKKGIRLIHILDNEWNDNKHIVKSRLNSIMGRQSVIYARKCNIKQVSSRESKVFLNDNHLQGNVRSSVRIGLYYDDKLVSLMTFGKSRFNKKYDYEMLRFCTICDMTVVGGAGKLLKSFINSYTPKSIISYSDRRWSNGGLYESLGFTFINNSSPNYRYTNDYKSLYSRHVFQKHKLSNILANFNPAQTEWENMRAHGYDRIWDCGNGVWVLNL